MTGSRFTLQTGPSLAAGSLGLVVGFLGLALDEAILGAAAGGLALVAGLLGLMTAQRMERQVALRAIVDNGAPATGTASGVGTSVSVAGSADRVAMVRGPQAHPARGPAQTPGPAAAGASDDAVVGINGDGDGNDALMDKATGLFSESFFRVALESRIAAARRHLRPIAVVLLEVVEGLPAGDPRPVDAKMVSTVIKATLREADTACRLRSGYFALLLEDTPENGAIWTVERMRRQLAEVHAGLTVWAGVACYPAHAFTPDEILSASERALVAAREWRQDRIEVAAAAD
ncbi:MAG: GGDEF domain-containing protein [Acidimicrobiia bacterium]|nr:GGDEF domain-containing protein [Acidimicrobiia bacterium]MDH4363329.1 GGDEF domain-containing protein [Acidimicrobiia bacterium]MDH5289969.1 GGDEF domain-containing protein [Acidimicrobiia bacterium]